MSALTVVSPAVRADIQFFDSALALMDRAFYCPEALTSALSGPDVLLQGGSQQLQDNSNQKGKKKGQQQQQQQQQKNARQRSRDAYNPAFAKSALQALIAQMQPQRRKAAPEPKEKLTKEQKRQARLVKLEARAEVKRQKKSEEKEVRRVEETANRLGVDPAQLKLLKQQMERPTVVSASEQMASLRGRLAEKLAASKAQRSQEQSVRDKAAKKRKQPEKSEAADPSSDDEQEEAAATPARPAKRSKKSKQQEDSDHDHNEDSDIESGDFQFAAVAERKFDNMTALDGKRKRKGDNKEAALKKILDMRDKVAALREEDPDRADDLERKHAIKAALLRSQGVAVKDDPTLLKKSLKREERQKKKSSKAWKERDQKVKTTIRQRQDSRNKNISDRTKEKQQKKLAKKGLI